LRIERLAGIVQVSKERPPDLTVGTIASDDIICLMLLAAFGRLNNHPRLVSVLPYVDDFVVPVHLCARLSLQVGVENFAEMVQRQDHHAVFLWHDDVEVHTRNGRAVRFSPCEVSRHVSCTGDVVVHTCPPQFCYGGRRIVRRPWLLADSFVGVEELDVDAVLGEEQGQEKAARSGADTDNLGKTHR
jgi:hypothetical protein